MQVIENTSIPFVGMPATIAVGSDRYPATVVEVKTPRKIVIQEDVTIDRASNTFTEDQKYTYFENPLAEKKVYSLRKDGCWMESGTQNGRVLFLGSRTKYRDPSF